MDPAADIADALEILAHDFRNLTNVAYLGMQMESLEAEDLNEIRPAVAQLMLALDLLIDAGRRSTGAREPQPVDLGELLEHSVRRAKRYGAELPPPALTARFPATTTDIAVAERALAALLTLAGSGTTPVVENSEPYQSVTVHLRMGDQRWERGIQMLIEAAWARAGGDYAVSQDGALLTLRLSAAS